MLCRGNCDCAFREPSAKLEVSYSLTLADKCCRAVPEESNEPEIYPVGPELYLNPRGRRLRNPNDVASAVRGLLEEETWLLTGDYALGVDTLRELWFAQNPPERSAPYAVRRRHSCGPSSWHRACWWSIKTMPLCPME